MDFEVKLIVGYNWESNSNIVYKLSKNISAHSLTSHKDFGFVCETANGFGRCIVRLKYKRQQMGLNPKVMLAGPKSAQFLRVCFGFMFFEGFMLNAGFASFISLHIPTSTLPLSPLELITLALELWMLHIYNLMSPVSAACMYVCLGLTS